LLSKIDQEQPPLAVIFGLSGQVLTDDEKALFKQANPLGFILFGRNCDNPQQVKALVKALNDCMGRDVPVLIDQEGGRVQRLGPPHWGSYDPAQNFEAALTKNFATGQQALADSAGKMAAELADLGIHVDCAPVLDVIQPDTHEAIGDRAFSQDPEICALLGSVMAEAFLKKGVVPVIKHIPGQGRARSDSHKDLPVVSASVKDLRSVDYVPFKELLTKAFSEAVWGMVSHIVYDAIDAQVPASCSRKVIYDAIRGDIGFQGLLLSDDICMGALDKYGDAAARADMVLRAGCDIALHCNGDLAEMTAIAARAPRMTDKAVKRYNSSAAWVRRNMNR